MRAPVTTPMLAAIVLIARQVVQEALHTRLPHLLAGVCAAALGLGAFIGALTLTETVQVQSALLGALLRLCAVFIVAGFTVTSIARETVDQGQALLLALPIPRAAYYAGKLAGFCLVAAIPALLFGALALLQASPLAAAVWTVSLLCELWIVAAFALLATLGLSGALAALAATALFYLLSRAIGGLQHLAKDNGSMLLDAIAALLPRLDLFARAEWLAYGQAGPAQLAPVLVQTALYLALLAGAALFDLYRREL